MYYRGMAANWIAFSGNFPVRHHASTRIHTCLEIACRRLEKFCTKRLNSPNRLHPLSKHICCLALPRSLAGKQASSHARSQGRNYKGVATLEVAAPWNLKNIREIGQTHRKLTFFYCESHPNPANFPKFFCLWTWLEYRFGITLNGQFTPCQSVIRGVRRPFLDDIFL